VFKDVSGARARRGQGHGRGGGGDRLRQRPRHRPARGGRGRTSRGSTGTSRRALPRRGGGRSAWRRATRGPLPGRRRRRTRTGTRTRFAGADAGDLLALSDGKGRFVVGPGARGDRPARARRSSSTTTATGCWTCWRLANTRRAARPQPGESLGGRDRRSLGATSRAASGERRWRLATWTATETRTSCCGCPVVSAVSRTRAATGKGSARVRPGGPREQPRRRRGEDRDAGGQPAPEARDLRGDSDARAGRRGVRSGRP
jgi:hypothetical protein